MPGVSVWGFRESQMHPDHGALINQALNRLTGWRSKAPLGLADWELWLESQFAPTPKSPFLLPAKTSLHRDPDRNPRALSGSIGGRLNPQAG